jgi:phosphoribosylformylglycinamidine cyclo-ligase
VVTGAQICAGQHIIGLPSSGLHSNGFSLVRRLVDNYEAPFGEHTLGQELLTPTKIYVKPVLQVLAKYPVYGMAHITGGGLYENVPRIIPDGLCAQIDSSQIPRQAIFDLIASHGVARDEMFATFNMGIGFILVVDSKHSQAIVEEFHQLGEAAVLIGEIVSGHHKICIS